MHKPRMLAGVLATCPNPSGVVEGLLNKRPSAFFNPETGFGGLVFGISESLPGFNCFQRVTAIFFCSMTTANCGSI